MKDKKFKRLNYKERILIEDRYCFDNKSLSYISRELNRSLSTISREIASKLRKGRGRYNADVAQRCSEKKRYLQGRSQKLDTYPVLREYVRTKLKQRWSPEQISIRLPIDFPDDLSMRISYESIYQFIYAQFHRDGHGMLKKDCEDLRKFLPRRHPRRIVKGARRVAKLERESSLPSIEDRPDVVNQRSRIGDWEDDIIVSRQSKVCIKSVNERRSGIVFFKKSNNATIISCDDALKKKLKQVPSQYCLTLTRDRGSENMGFKQLSKNLKMSIYFAHPYCSHERGSNENNNGLFRRFFPKKTNFATVPEQDIATVEKLINSRPRKRLGGLTPYEVFYKETGVALET